MDDETKTNVGVGPILRGDRETIDYDELEYPGPELFPDLKNASFTVNVKTCGANAVSVRLMPEVEYMKIGISRKSQRLILVPCDEYDVKGYKWARDKDGRRYGTERTGKDFVILLCKMLNWNPEERHRIPGKLTNDGKMNVMSYDLKSAKHFPKGSKGSTTQLVDEWDGHFGSNYADANRSYQIDKHDQFTVWTLKEGDTEQVFVRDEERQDE